MSKRRWYLFRFIILIQCKKMLLCIKTSFVWLKKIVFFVSPFMRLFCCLFSFFLARGCFGSCRVVQCLVWFEVFFYSFVDFFQWLDEILSRIFFPVVFFVKFSVSCFFKFFFYSNFFWMGLKKKFYSMKEVFYVSFFIYRKHGLGRNVKVNMQIFFSAWRDFMWQEEKL